MIKNKFPLVKLFIGIALITLGLGFLLDQMNIINFGCFMADWWPMFIIIPSLINLIFDRKNWFIQTFIILVGLIFLGKNLDILPNDFFKTFWKLFWPSILILVGGSIVFRLFRNPKNSSEDANSSDKMTPLFVLFSGRDYSSNSKNFLGGDVTAIFGGVDMDLRQVELGENATLDILCIFGGVDIKIPKNIRVKTNGFPIFGGIDNSTDEETPNAKILTINTNILFGGVDIKN